MLYCDGIEARRGGREAAVSAAMDDDAAMDRFAGDDAGAVSDVGLGSVDMNVNYWHPMTMERRSCWVVLGLADDCRTTLLILSLANCPHTTPSSAAHTSLHDAPEEVWQCFC